MNRTAAAALAVCLLTPAGLYRENEPADTGYILRDSTDPDTVLFRFDTWAQAEGQWNTSKDSYGNLCIEHEGKVLAAEYAAVLIPSGEGCALNTLYTASDGKQGYINGCYGKDAWYAGTSADGTKVSFAISGVIGTADIHAVEICPLENAGVPLTSYICRGGMLYHRIRTDMGTDTFSSQILLDEAFEPLQEGSIYYSWDGHYFYDNERDLIDDLKRGQHDHSINEEPYYCYYQFLSHRSISSVQPSDLREYITRNMAVSGSLNRYLDQDGDSISDILNRSQYYESEQAFYQYQYQYGANALMMFAVSCNESGRGKSSLSYTRNNLFGHAAYDTAVEENASRYSSVEKSIYSHARYYLSRSYCNPYWENCRGAFFGNKAAGMNVNYASDPYWGEKAAAFCGMIDRAYEGKDSRSETVAILGGGTVTVYRDQACTSVLYTASVPSDYAVIILGEEGDVYRIQSDLTVGRDDEAYAYDFRTDTGYIPKKSVIYILSEEKTDARSSVHVTFDAAGGVFADGTSRVSYSMRSGDEAACTAPAKENMLFVGWDKDTASVQNDTVFSAVYAPVKSMELTSLPQTEYAAGDVISLSGGMAVLTLENGETREYELTTSMVSDFDLDQPGDQTVTVRISGCTASYPIRVTNTRKSEESSADPQKIYDILYMYEQKSMRASEAKAVLALKKETDDTGVPPLTMVQRMKLDTLIRRALGDRTAFVLKSDFAGAGVSGAAVAAPLSEMEGGSLFARRVIRVCLDRSDIPDEVKNSAQMLGYTPAESVRVTYVINGTEVNTYEPLVISVPKTDRSLQYRVLHMTKERDILDSRTVETENFVRFIAAENGTYLIIARPADSPDTTPDITESLTEESSSNLALPYLLAAGCGAAAILLLILLIRGIVRRRR